MLQELRLAFRSLAKSPAFAAIAILKLVVRQGMSLTAVGIVVGLLGAFALTRLLASLLFAVGATDAGTFVWIPLLLVSVSFFACYIPARRAAKLDPITALART